MAYRFKENHYCLNVSRKRYFCKEIMLIKAAEDSAQYQKIWNNYVLTLKGESEVKV